MNTIEPTEPIAKQYELGGTKITIRYAETTVAEARRNLTMLYDLLNKVARENNLDQTGLFYTDEEIEEMKKDPRYTWI